MTVAFRRFCSDYRAQLLTDHVRRFVQGEDRPDLEAETRARAAQVLEILMLDPASILDFYTAPQETEAAPAWTDPLTAAIPPGVLEALNATKDNPE